MDNNPVNTSKSKYLGKYLAFYFWHQVFELSQHARCVTRHDVMTAERGRGSQGGGPGDPTKSVFDRGAGIAGADGGRRSFINLVQMRVSFAPRRDAAVLWK